MCEAVLDERERWVEEGKGKSKNSKRGRGGMGNEKWKMKKGKVVY